MEYRPLGRTGLDVSVLCLGSMTWGEQNSETDGHAQIDLALDRGINFVDTAEMYAIPPRPETAGRTEQIIGSWLANGGRRERIVLATKVTGRSDMTWLRPGADEVRLTRDQIHQALDGSLRRLNTDYIDLYQVHWPDRSTDLAVGPDEAPDDGDAVPIEETLGALADLVAAGKVRHVGLSNETPWGTMRYLRLAEAAGLPRVAAIQNAYNLLNRTFEDGLAEIAMREQVGLLAYSPLAQGYLTGKYEGGALPPGARKTLFDRMQRYETPGAAPAITAYLELARAHGLDPAALALRFVTTRPFVTSAILGATTLDQLEADIASMSVVMSEELLRGIEQIHMLHTNPCP